MPKVKNPTLYCGNCINSRSLVNRVAKAPFTPKQPMIYTNSFKMETFQPSTCRPTFVEDEIQTICIYTPTSL